MSERLPKMLEPRGAFGPAIVVDALGLAGRYATGAEVRSWSERMQRRAYDWAMREHLSAAEEPGDYPGRTRRVPMPEHVAQLPIVEGVDFDGSGHATRRLLYANGRRSTITTEIPR